MRRLLGVLRQPDEPAAGPELSPQPGVAELAALAEGVRAAGLPVVLVIDGDPDRLPAAVDISAYRIVQEALTNVLKHAGRASAQVSVRCGVDEVFIEVTDDGAGPQLAGPAGGGEPAEEPAQLAERMARLLSVSDIQLERGPVRQPMIAGDRGLRMMQRGELARRAAALGLELEKAQAGVVG